MHTLYLLSVFLHILAAMVWIGGMLFLVMVIVPLLRQPEWRARAAALVQVTGRRFRSIGWACLLVLTVTGLFNLYVRSGKFALLSSADYWRSPFGQVLSIKILLVGIILVLSFIHDLWIGPEATKAWQVDAAAPRTRELRQAASWLGRLNLLLSLVVVALAIMLVRGVPG